MAYEVLKECKQGDEATLANMLLSKLPNWGGETCMTLAELSNNMKFIAHDAVETIIARIWTNGQVEAKTQNRYTRIYNHTPL